MKKAIVLTLGLIVFGTTAFAAEKYRKISRTYGNTILIGQVCDQIFSSQEKFSICYTSAVMKLNQTKSKFEFTTAVLAEKYFCEGEIVHNADGSTEAQIAYDGCSVE